MVTMVIDGTTYQAEANLNLLQFMIDHGIDVPYLCHREGLTPYGACRLCMVQVVAGSKPGITTSCTLTTSEGLTVETKTPDVVQIRKMLLELYLAEAPGSKKIRELAAHYGVHRTRFERMDLSAKGDRCVLCGLCLRVCSELLDVGAIHYSGRGKHTSVNTPWYQPSAVCIGCGACEYVCPADAVDIIDQGDERVMETWHKTRLKLKECAESMKRFATERVVDRVCDKNRELLKDLKDLSPDARRRKKAAQFIFGSKPR